MIFNLFVILIVAWQSQLFACLLLFPSALRQVLSCLEYCKPKFDFTMLVAQTTIASSMLNNPCGLHCTISYSNNSFPSSRQRSIVLLGSQMTQCELILFWQYHSISQHRKNFVASNAACLIIARYRLPIDHPLLLSIESQVQILDVFRLVL